MRIPSQAGGDPEARGILRLRRAARVTRRAASLRMTVFVWSVLVSALGVALLSSVAAAATSYYVSSSSGSDANPGTQAQPFQTLAKVNGLSLNPGDSVYLKRGDTWSEQLIPGSSGTSGNAITFDAYGTGAAPVLTPRINLSGATWVHNSGNVYTTTLSTAIASPQINNLQLGNIWGRKRTANPGCATAGVIAGYGDFCVVYPTLYLYSPNGTLPPAYYTSIDPVVGQASGLAVISIVSKSWLVFEHIKIQNFDYMGVSVTGTSDNLVFANMESDGMVPYGTTPHGFYVSAPGAGNIQFLNDDAHLNYDGFHFDGAAGITVTNCRAYANRDNGLKDNSGHATYTYSHFYGNNVAQLVTSDVVGGIAGSGNISSAIAPVVTNFNTYPARFSFTVDDVGSSAGTEAYINTFLASPSGPYYLRPNVKFNAAVVPSYAGQNGENSVDWASVNNWYAAGNEIDSHSWSHQYYTTNTNPCGLPPCTPPYPNAPALDIKYTGNGTVATVTISGNTLSLNVAGAVGDSHSVDLTSASYSQMWQLEQYLTSLPNYSVTYDQSGPLVRPNTHSVNLLTVTNQDIKSGTAILLYDQAKLEPDELLSSKTAIQTSVPGVTENFFVYPDGIEDPTIEADAVAAGYTAARGSLAMKGQDNTTATANSLYSNGVNVQNITSLGAIQIHGMSQIQINQLVESLVFRASAWGIPYGLFTHYNSRGDNTADISNVELGWLLDAVTANGGVWMTNTALASAITAGNALSGTTRYVQNPTGNAVDLSVAGATSPSVARGAATSYPVDLNGVNRQSLGAWDIGAVSYISQRYGTGSGSGSTIIGWPSSTFTLPVNANFFGVHYNQTATAFPDNNFAIGFPIVRLWDTATGWADLQSNANCTNTVTMGCNFGKMDTWLNKFSGEQVIWTIAKTPNFIASNASDANCGYTSTLGNPNGSCTPPTDLNCDGTGTDATYIQFLTALMNHVGPSKINYFEIGNEWNVNTFWDMAYINGTRCVGYSDAVEKMLIRMTQDTQCVIQGKNCNPNGTYPKTGMDPAALIMSPPVNGPASGPAPYNSGGTEYKLLADGIGNYVDVISTHGYVTTSTTCTPPSNANCAVPEAIDSALDILQADMQQFNVNKPVMISEFSWGATSGTTDPQYEQAFVGRYYTLAAQQGVLSANWYYLATGSNSCSIGPILQLANGTLCPTGSAVAVIQDWLSGATFTQPTYTKTPRNDCAAGSNIYEFPLMAWNGMVERIVYYDGMANTSACTYSVPAGFTFYQDMTGANHSLLNVATVTLDNRPILLQQAGAPNYLGAQRRPGHELDVLQLNNPIGCAVGDSTCAASQQTWAQLNCPTGTAQSNASGCLPQLGGVTGAGTVVQNAATGQRIGRLTDSVTDPNASNGQIWVNLQGNSEQANTASLDDQFICVGKGGAYDNIIGFNPTTLQPNLYTPTGKSYQTSILWVGNGNGTGNGSGTSGAWGFNWCTASRVTPALFYDVTQTPVLYAAPEDHNGVIYTVNAATDPAVHTPGGIPTPTVVTDITTNSCFNNARYAGSVPFYPLNMVQSLISVNDTTLGFSVSSVRRGCWDPNHGLVDWQPNTAYTANQCGSISCGSALGGVASITPMDGNAGGWTYQIQTAGTSGSAAPTWCQTVSCTVNDGSTVWIAYKQQANWGGARSGSSYIGNSCSLQGYDTLLVMYHVKNGDGVIDTEVAGDCDVYDTAQGYSYHNGTSLGPVDMSAAGFGTMAANPYLFTNHVGTGTQNPQVAVTAPTTCIGTLQGGWGSSCSSVFMNNNVVWKAGTTTIGGQLGLGHTALGYNNIFGSTTMPTFAEEPIMGTTKTRYFNNNWSYTGTYKPGEVGNHSSANNNGAQETPLDQTPFVVGAYNPLTGYNGYDKPFVDPGVTEIMLYSFKYGYPIRECQPFSSEEGSFQSRYHVFNVSQSGRFVFFTMDGENQFTTAGASCGPDWQPNTAYTAGTYLLPLLNNAPFNNNLNACVFQVTTGGTSASTAPNWQSISGYTANPQTCTGSVTDANGVVYQAVPGGSSCRSDIGVCELR
ncbi:MAG TPA: hypothetical protein VGS27_12595 [Candidatus Sulfotelmatobacter sp.]|nr:hypothetical protein [Candidatus Sulfotelmatobacter sp.]